jgi:hypothetical protein
VVAVLLPCSPMTDSCFSLDLVPLKGGRAVAASLFWRATRCGGPRLVSSLAAAAGDENTIVSVGTSKRDEPNYPNGMVLAFPLFISRRHAPQ